MHSERMVLKPGVYDYYYPDYLVRRGTRSSSTDEDKTSEKPRLTPKQGGESPRAPARTRNAAKRTVEPPTPTAMLGQPPNFLRLKRFFSSQTALASALGVHRDTIHKWDLGQASRLSRSSVERVLVMSAVAEQVARFMPTDASVGTWLLQPQPALGGDIPAHLIRRDGVISYERILKKAVAIAEPVSVGSLGGLPEEVELLTEMSPGSVDQLKLAPGAEDSDEDPDFLASLAPTGLVDAT